MLLWMEDIASLTFLRVLVGGMMNDKSAETISWILAVEKIIGQGRVREQLSLVLKGALRRGAGPGSRAAVRAARAGQDHASR